jgi:hypothetical protein
MCSYRSRKERAEEVKLPYVCLTVCGHSRDGECALKKPMLDDSGKCLSYTVEKGGEK